MAMWTSLPAIRVCVTATCMRLSARAEVEQTGALKIWQHRRSAPSIADMASQVCLIPYAAAPVSSLPHSSPPRYVMHVSPRVMMELCPPPSLPCLVVVLFVFNFVSNIGAILSFVFLLISLVSSSRALFVRTRALCTSITFFFFCASMNLP